VQLFICKRERIHGDDLLDIDGVSNNETGLDERNFTFVYDIMANQIIKPDNNHQVGNIYVDNNDKITATTGSNALLVKADGEGDIDPEWEPGDDILPEWAYFFDARLEFTVEVVK